MKLKVCILVFCASVAALAQEPATGAQDAVVTGPEASAPAAAPARDMPVARPITIINLRDVPDGVRLGLPPIFADVRLNAAMPDSKDGWVLHVITRGGIGGRGLGDVTVTSGRAVSCGEPARCPASRGGRPIEQIAEIVARAAFAPWNGARSLCSDCYATLVVLRRRQTDGTESVSSAWWDVSTQGAVAQELRELSSLALALRD